MTPEILDTAITEFLQQAGQKLEQAVQIAKAAEACAEAGNPKKAVEIIMDIEDLVFRATALLDGATVLQSEMGSEDAEG
jgi:ATP/maltotriose-dependent transcriptional regulator MalT